MRPKVALMWRGSREARSSARLEDSRFKHLSEALQAVGLEPQAAVYGDDFVEEVYGQLLGVDGVLVWINPIQDGQDRRHLDPLLRQVAQAGVYVSAHPQVILSMGTKEVLYQTRQMSWGGDIYLYQTLEELRSQLPLRLAEGRPRVLKQYRGNDGNGVWKVEPHPTHGVIRVRHAYQRAVEQEVSLEAFVQECQAYFAGPGRMIDQPFQPRISEGMVRCYLVQDQVAGFGHQAVNALYPAAPDQAAQPTQRLYYPQTQPEFQAIRNRMESEWVGAMCECLGLVPSQLPILWDADFLLGPKGASGQDSHVLCEINVSSVYPFPDSALPLLAQATLRQLKSR
jgi:hypothetical protein